MKKIQISPSILSADFSQLDKEIKRLEDGGADMIHVDVMDGHFVPNLTIGPPVIKALRNHTKLPFDVHLMIKPVHKYIKDYAKAGADIITIHPEATDNLNDSIKHIKELGKKVGVSLNPETKIDIIKESGDDREKRYFEEEVSHFFQRILFELVNSKRGIDNLKLTYTDDISITSRIELILSKIIRHTREIESILKIKID